MVDALQRASAMASALHGSTTVRQSLWLTPHTRDPQRIRCLDPPETVLGGDSFPNRGRHPEV